MRTKDIIYFLLFTLSGNSLSAQSVIPVTPASSEVASFEKYIDQPVSLNSGMVDISIPIYSLKEGQLEVPVSLSYYAGGIKVEETASRVGLGWNLNAGGFISRSVKGLPDDSPTGYMYTNRTVAEFHIGMEDAQFSTDYIGDRNNRDYEPDCFNFNFLNFSGRFFFDKSTLSFIQVPFNNYKLEPSFNTNGTISSWIFTDEKGIKYYFGNTRDTENRTQVEKQFAVSTTNFEETGITGQNISADQYVSSWFLLKIESPKHDVISLYYQQSALYDDVLKTESSEFKIWGCFGENDQDYSIESYLRRTIADTYLAKISSKTQDIIFENKTEARLDVPAAKALASISIKNGAALFKKYVLDYEYFISSDNNYRWTIGNSAGSRYRLKLKSVQEQTATQTLPPYQFTYDTSNQLPNKTSYAQDAWGYYNGANDNNTLLPKIFSPYVTDALIGSADRHVKLAYATAGTLTKIKYPTGGSREFVYESNEVGLIVNLRDSNMFGEMTTKNDGLFPDDPGLNSPEMTNGIRLQNNYSKQFTVNNVTGSLNVNLDVEGSMGNLINTTGCHFTFKLSGITDPGYVLFFSQKTNAIKIPNGTYKIEAIKQGDPLSMFGFAIALSWDEMVLSDNGAARVGGLRIKKMITSDNLGNSLTKEFRYNKFDINKSSGYCINYPIFMEPHYFNCPFGYKFSSQSQMPSTNLGKSTIAYENVTEFDIDQSNNTNNGKTEYTYLTNYGIISAGWASNQHMEVLDKTDKYIGWQVGYLLQADVYKAQGAGFAKIQSTLNTYETVGTYTISDFGAMTEMRIEALVYLIYPLTSDWFRQKSSTTINYFDIGDPITTSESYSYNINPLLRFQTSKTNSLGDEIITKTFYPDDIINTASINPPLTTAQLQVINLLKSNNQHQLSQPVQNEVFVKKGNITSKTETIRTNYKDWGNNIVFPESFQSAKGSGALEIKSRYDVIDNTNGNPLQYTQESGIPTSIIWGYNKTQPIAKIENASYSEVFSFVPNLQNLSDTGTEAALLSALSALRAALPGAMVTTYTYIPAVGVHTVTDPKGNTTNYAYDTLGRLEFVKDKDLNVLQKYCYNYKGQQIDCDITFAGDIVYKSIARSGYFAKKGCALGQTGSNVFYSQSQGIETSSVSQADADAKGLARFEADGQANANTNGICTTPLPAAPAGLVFTSSTTTSLNFSWTAVAGATSYKIYKNGSDTGITSSTNTGSLSGLTASTAYSIQVLAVNASGNSALSTAVSMTTAATPVSNSCTLNFERESGTSFMYKNGSRYLTRSTSGTSSGTLAAGDTFYVTVSASSTYYKGIVISSSVRGSLYNTLIRTGSSVTSPTFTKTGSEVITIDCITTTMP